MGNQKNEIYRKTRDGGVQLAASADRWYLYEDFVHLSPHHTGDEEGRLMKFEAELAPFVDNIDRGALLVIDMQNDFCSPGGWTDASGLNYNDCREAIPGIQRAIDAARQYEMWVIWVYWHNRPDLRNLGAPTLYSFKHKPSQVGIGQELERGQVLTEGSWNTEMINELKPYMSAEDIHIEKVRMSAFHGTHLDQVLRTQGINTLYFSGVNMDQCVTASMQEAYFRDYNVVLLEDATATSSPSYCRDAVIFNTKECWGFVTDTDKFASAQAVQP